MACRTFNRSEYCGLSFIGSFLLILGLTFVFIYEFLILLSPALKLPLLVLISILLFMVLWCLLATAYTEPGRVPFYWGMTPENNEAEQRKYCLHCHNFKPERSHHCSTCRKCVLNMDHHCPWVNNCIGFHNRKHFILFLFYLELGLITMAIVCSILMFWEFKRVAQTGDTDIHFALRLICLLTAVPLAFTIGAFFLFHFNMVLTNTTTLENMLQKRNFDKPEDTAYNSKPIEDYDVGKW